ncbi:Calx-beta domain-containing protein [Solimonas marina]|uniref:Calx-beta domain-containing protein n=1 Tax=Solimonas marina TaxID=2714601 RepID=A0A970B7I9_9GAMM|nr:Calx-beta domain-containing protein [Solimonas marina]NKF23720.1 hypothetical protein [Solimonas marina]
MTGIKTAHQCPTPATTIFGPTRRRSWIGAILLLIATPVLATPSPGTLLYSVPFGDADATNRYPDVAIAPDGSFVTAWLIPGGQVWAQHFAAGGTPRGDAFQVGTTAGNSLEGLPSIAFDADGGYAIGWITSAMGYKLALYDADDQLRTALPQALVNSGTLFSARLAMDAQGNLAVASLVRAADQQSHSVRIRHIEADGTRGADTQLDDHSTGILLDVASNASGATVVVWGHSDADADGNTEWQILAQRLNADGTPLGAPIPVNPQPSPTTLDKPVVAVDALGAFVVAWRKPSPSGDLLARRFDASGTALGDPWVVNTPDSTDIFSNFEFYPSIAMRPQGDFAIAWVGGSGPRVHTRLYGADGNSIGAEHPAMISTSAPSAAMDRDGNVVVASENWTGAGFGQVQRFASTEDIDLNAALQGSRATAAAGQEIDYTLFIDNRHAAATETVPGQSTGLTADVSLSGAAFDNANGPGWTCSGTGPVHCRYEAVIAPGGTAAALTIAARAAPGVAAATASARINGDQYDRNAGNDLATTSTSVDSGTVLPGSVQFGAANYSVAENGGAAVVTVSRIGGSDGDISVHVRTADHEALAGSDYGAVDLTLNWPDGDAAPQTISVPIIDDQTAEPSKTFALSLDTPSGGATLGAPITSTVTILDDDAPPAAAHGTIAFSTASYSAAEGAQGELVVLRTNGSDGVASVDFTTSGGNAVDGQDYTAVSGALTWADGDDTPKRILVPTTDNSTVEPDRTVNVTLNHAQGATLDTPAGATLTIVNDDFAPTEPIVVKDSGGGAFGTLSLLILAGFGLLRRRAG